MKYLYLILLTFFTITYTDAADRADYIDEGLITTFASAETKKAFRPATRSATPSEAGSLVGSYVGSLGGASTIIGSHTLYELEITTNTNVAEEFKKLMAAYRELLKISSKTDTRLSQFAGFVERILPEGIDRASADEDDLTSLQTGFRQLRDMYKVLRKSYDGVTGKTTILESTVTELQAAQDELKKTMAKMAPRPTEFVGTAMSPERVFATRETEADSSDVVKNLRAQVAELNAEITALNAAATSAADAATVEKERLVAENLELKKAMKLSTTGASKGNREPLLDKSGSSLSRDGGYTRLNDGEAASQGQGGNGCPCSVM